MAKLSASLVLNKFILSLFGVTDLQAISSDLKDAVLEGYDENNVSYFYHALVDGMFTNENIPKELLLQYDQNIFSHTSKIGIKREHQIRWKYFQYLTLLFTEIYLDRYFTDKEKLCTDLNNFLRFNHGRNKNDFSAVTDFELSAMVNDLNKLAYWNATGSGKTLLMHINILQYRYYLNRYNLSDSLSRILVLTPNEGLSKQHLREFENSGLEAELFDKYAGSLFVGKKIEIIDIHKLEETSGDKTVAVETFEGNNLVLVDEGHRGAGGYDWKDKRNRLCESGFSFEYSATFGQAVHALSGAKQKTLLNEYGKATLFDYSYKYFYEDGYGKDYQILNLNEQWHEPGKEERVQLYLTASLLSFYEQILLFKKHEQELSKFLIEKPLAIFVGGKVTKSISKEIASDVVEVLQFLSEFVRNADKSKERIRLLLDSKDGLNDVQGRSIFRSAFRKIRQFKITSTEVYTDMLKQVFNSEVAGATLHIDNLKGQDGEIGLRIGNADYFGVINVGDDKGLLKICESHKMLVDEKEFSSSLFHEINSRESKINILIGSKKFSEGWSSWRVSSMGLLNIGRGEGTEIIQLFGRGVRLKGYKFSLKRSSALDLSLRPSSIPDYLSLLETLNIFGLRADYMQQFKDYLEEEGLPADGDSEEISINIIPTLADLRSRNLKYIHVKAGSDFKKAVKVDVLPSEFVRNITLNWYAKVQVLKSGRAVPLSEITSIETGKLLKAHLAFLDWTDLYFSLQNFKNERSWYNLNLSMTELKRILENPDWYVLEIPSAELEVSDFSQVKVWQEIALSLLKSYTERLYNYQKNLYYGSKFEVSILDSTHPNFEIEYRLLIKKSEEQLISRLRELKEKIKANQFSENIRLDANFEFLYNQVHLYQPLVYLGKEGYQEVLKIQPVALNKGERGFVEDLKTFYNKTTGFFTERQVYLLRNLSKRGIGFFEANHFYPDFILWIVSGEKQYVSFVDPKGLRQVQGFMNPKIQLHKKIKSDVQPQLSDKEIELNSFIISPTLYEEVSYWSGRNSIEDFNNHNIFFQHDQRNYYIQMMLEKIVEEIAE